MTAQVSDTMIYRGKDDYAIAALNNQHALFDPKDHGITPVGRCSACWRGYICTYTIEDGEFLLTDLAVWLDGTPPVLFGVTPRVKPKFASAEEWVASFKEEDAYDFFFGGDARYENMRHRIPYTGKLLLARDFIDELYVHMGFHPAWKFREVHEIVLRDGHVVSASDRSADMAEVRRGMLDRKLEPGAGASPAEIQRWIKECFNQEYDW